MQQIPLHRSFINPEVKDSVLRVLESGRFVRGEECRGLEGDLAAFAGVRQAMLFPSHREGLLRLLQLMRAKAGDEIILPALAPLSTLEPVLQLGAQPVWVDVDDTLCMDVNQLESAVNPRVVGILPVHLHGHPANLDRVMEVAGKHHIWVIEDGVHSWGARYHGQAVGTRAPAAVFSIDPSSNLSVLGQGGCLFVNNIVLARKLRSEASPGPDASESSAVEDGECPFNEIQAAAGRVALRHLESLNEHRRLMAEEYHQRLQGLVSTPREMPWAHSVYSRYVIRAEHRDELAEFLGRHEVETSTQCAVPLPHCPLVARRGRGEPATPHADLAGRDMLALPMSGEITSAEIGRICDYIRSFYDRL